MSHCLRGTGVVLYDYAVELERPLADCLHICHQERLAVRLQLLDSWTRTYQVAPDRTHPEMSTYPPTGFVLGGIKVAPPSV